MISAHQFIVEAETLQSETVENTRRADKIVDKLNVYNKVSKLKSVFMYMDKASSIFVRRFKRRENGDDD